MIPLYFVKKRGFFGILFLALSLPCYSYRLSEPTCIHKYLRQVEITYPYSGMDLVDCIYLINLDERQDRLQRVTSMLEEHGLFANRLSAVNGWKLSNEALVSLGGPYGIHMGLGHFGCLLSHLSLLMNALEHKFQIVWVIEDDAVILKDVHCIPSLIKELDNFDPDWDVLYTDTDYRSPKGGYVRALATNARPGQPVFPLGHYAQKIKVTPNLIRIYNRYATHSMIISKRGVEKMVDYFTHVYLWQPIDIDMHYIPGLKEYTTAEDIVSNMLNENDSDIASSERALP